MVGPCCACFVKYVVGTVAGAWSSEDCASMDQFPRHNCNRLPTKQYVQPYFVNFVHKHLEC